MAGKTVPVALHERTVDLIPLTLRGALGSINDEARTVEVTFSTGAAVERMDPWTCERWIEKLSLKPEHIRLGRINSGAAPVLDTHSAWSISDQIGVVEADSVRLLNAHDARATLRFSKRETVNPIWGDVRDRIYRSVSMAYKVFKFEEDTSKANKLPVRTGIDWEPHEISMVPMPADAGAQVRAGDKSHTNQCVIVPRIDDADRVRRFRLAMAR